MRCLGAACITLEMGDFIVRWEGGWKIQQKIPAQEQERQKSPSK